jgi:glycosyltransferase involved in cell wall biosynthesis
MASNFPISVIMAVYNNEKYLREAIDSILKQSFREFELIIIDDCSTDSSELIINEYGKLDSRLVIHRQHMNSGVAIARNVGLQLSQGEYIALMDSDDISLPDRLEKQYRFIKAHPEIGVVGGGAEIVDSDGNHLSMLHFPETNLMISWSLCYYDPIVNPTVMMRRNIVRDAGGYFDLRKSLDEYYPEDYDLWTRLSEKTSLYNLSDVVLKLRKHGKNITIKYPESTTKYSLNISQNYIAQILGERPSIESIAVLWGTDQRKGISAAQQVLIRLYNIFRNRDSIRPMEKKILRKDVSLRLFRMAKSHPKDPESIKVLFQAFLYDPIIIFRVLVARIKRIKER